MCIIVEGTLDLKEMDLIYIKISQVPNSLMEVMVNRIPSDQFNLQK